MKNPRMPNKQMKSDTDERPTENEARKEDQEAFMAHQWGQETIVVNGQAMTVTFPLEEN